jgi:hypothetical protein
VDYIKERLESFDAAILSTVYQLEERSVTGNTYEKTPNDKTLEFYMDERYGANEVDAPEDGYHVQLFETAVRACKESGSIRHLVVLETPRTTERVEDFISILEREEMKYTYIRARHLKKDKMYSFEKGVKEKLAIKLHDGTSSLLDESKYEDEAAVFREDVAALIVQSLMTLDWNKSRILEVSATSESIVSSVSTEKRSKQKFDREWCPNSGIYAEMLAQFN